jgi:hypothetical protein
VKEAQAVLAEALEREGEAQRLLLDGRTDEAELALREVAALYRRSWEAAPPRAFGRLAGMLKAAILAGGGEEEAEYARAEVREADSPASGWVLALAALALGDDAAARRAAQAMRPPGSEAAAPAAAPNEDAFEDAFHRAAEAVDALAAGDGARYAAAVSAIVRDFESRDGHVTGVAIADTALVLERLAERRGLATAPDSRLLPPHGQGAADDSR